MRYRKDMNLFKVARRWEPGGSESVSLGGWAQPHLDSLGQNLEQTGPWALPGLELLSCCPQRIQLDRVKGERG